MPLDPEKIKRLMEVKNRPKPKRGGRKKGGIDVSIRTEETWFKLRTHFYNEQGERAECENSECVDPRPPERGKLVAEIEGTWMCRYCFLDGFKSTNPAQEEITDAA